MNKNLSHLDYLNDAAFMAGYAEYQKRYAATMRESDRVVIDIVKAHAAEHAAAKGQPLELLDIGCSTGNLLLHLKNNAPGVTLTGGDMVPSILDDCKRDSKLSGIRFEEMNVLDLPQDGAFDIIIANAVLCIFDEVEYSQAVRSISGALRSGGLYIGFDWLHEYRQELAIREKSKTHPEGMMLYFRPYEFVRSHFEAVGFSRLDFRPFQIPVDLEKPSEADDIRTYTRTDDKGARLLFRGTLFQPWCHMIARKV